MIDSVDQQPIRINVAFPMSAKITRQCMVAIRSGKRNLLSKQGNNLIELRKVSSLLPLSFDVLFKLRRIGKIEYA